MKDNFSPWIAQLKQRGPVVRLTKDHSTQLAIVGAGLAGVSTAYYALKHTNSDVALIEAGKAAQGATGHNAGQIVSYFERQFSDLVQEYGLEMAGQAQAAIDSGWLLIEEIFAETHITTPIERFTGYAGFQDLTEILIHLENNYFTKKAKLQVEPLTLAIEAEELKNIPAKYEGLYNRLPQKHILSLLETDDKRFIAMISAQKGCMNSALFCEDVIDYMLNTYPNRFALIEQSPVSEVILSEKSASLKIHHHTVAAEKVVLCTNGFEQYNITNLAGKDINQSFHHLVRGSVGYMAGYLETYQRSPVAISYLPKHDGENESAFEADPYFYLTRRTFQDGKKKQSLVCIGGPESLMDDTNNYQKQHPYPQEAQEAIDQFLHKTFKYAPKKKIKYKYKWHGLMGYTPNGVRCIGPEPRNPILLYNLGCNGVGILPCIYGGKKISQFLNGEKLKPSVFDPIDFEDVA